mgnify:CR=1 FL=1|tara:strand:+ start:370 stop:744 length:375 start_codon:yes stop_codon:yes gene_type:complete
MVRNNYKWNIEKEKGIIIAKDNITKILKESKNNTLELNELVFLLNNRTRNLDLQNNNKKKTLTNFLKIVCKGVLQFIDDYDDYLVIKKNDKIYISYNKKKLFDELDEFAEFDEWIFINKENIES